MVTEQNTFKKGSWYKIRNGQFFLNIVKCSLDSVNNTSISGCCYVNLQNNKENKQMNKPLFVEEEGTWSNIYEFEKVNISEVLPFLPKSHPDLLLLHSPENLLSKLIIW